MRKIPRHIREDARDIARQIAKTDAYTDASRRRKKVEMLFAHLKKILQLDRLRLRGPNGAKDEFLLAATAQNPRKLAELRTAAPYIAYKPSKTGFGNQINPKQLRTFSTTSAVCSVLQSRLPAPTAINIRFTPTVISAVA
ncbi:transposase [Thalassococcus sp. S3]|uniref:transposase n=1 Tax=Thalassococcus sp. S3 TaxID=2017482 RepID=UPI001C2CAC1A